MLEEGVIAMDGKSLIVISTAEKEKALTGLMSAKNALSRKWLDDVKVLYFGPVEKLMTEDPGVSNAA